MSVVYEHHVFTIPATGSFAFDSDSSGKPASYDNLPDFLDKKSEEGFELAGMSAGLRQSSPMRQPEVVREVVLRRPKKPIDRVKFGD